MSHHHTRKEFLGRILAAGAAALVLPRALIGRRNSKSVAKTSNEKTEFSVKPERRAVARRGGAH